MIRRRSSIALLGSAAIAWPLVARGQQPLPVIGFLHSGTAEQNVKRVAAFRKGLAEAGFVEGRNVAIEFRWAGGQNARLPELAAELVARQVAVIVTLSSTVATVAARAATKTVPIFFLIAESPVDLGFVASFSRPGGNATGIATLNAELGLKRLELLRELAPQAATLAVLLNPNQPGVKQIAAALQATAATLGVPLQTLEATTDAEIEAAFAALKPGTALLIGTNPSFFVRRAQLVALSARHAVPAIYDSSESATAGGLISYGPDVENLWQQSGVSVARILKGAKPADLPVAQPTKFQLVVNLKTAKALGLTLPPSLLARADEIIE